MRKIIDTFLFFNELEMLDFHLHAMNDCVDYFVLGESTETHAGNEKDLYFDMHREKYAQFADKIIYVEIEKSSIRNDAWGIENFQRDALLRGIEQVPDVQASDIVLVADVDEIVDETLLNSLSPIKNNAVFALEQDIYYYNINSRFREKQYFTHLCNVGLARERSLTDIRNNMRARILRPGGWHFSYFGSPATISTKIQNFSHQDLNQPRVIDQTRIQSVIDSGIDLYGRNQKKPEKYKIDKIPIEENEYLPRHYEKLIGCENWPHRKPKAS